jgi:hypothetical protein
MRDYILIIGGFTGIISVPEGKIARPRRVEPVFYNGAPSLLLLIELLPLNNKILKYLQEGDDAPA